MYPKPLGHENISACDSLVIQAVHDWVQLSILTQGWIQDLVKGRPKFFWPIFADSVQLSHANEVSPY